MAVNIVDRCPQLFLSSFFSTAHQLPQHRPPPPPSLLLLLPPPLLLPLHHRLAALVLVRKLCVTLMVIALCGVPNHHSLNAVLMLIAVEKEPTANLRHVIMLVRLLLLHLPQQPQLLYVPFVVMAQSVVQGLESVLKARRVHVSLTKIRYTECETGGKLASRTCVIN